MWLDYNYPIYEDPKLQLPNLWRPQIYNNMCVIISWLVRLHGRSSTGGPAGRAGDVRKGRSSGGPLGAVRAVRRAVRPSGPSGRPIVSMIWAMPEFKHLLSHDGFPKKKSCDNLIYKHPKNCNFGEILFFLDRFRAAENGLGYLLNGTY